MKTKKKELTSLEKIIVMFMIICLVTFIMRVCDPAFLGWFHISPMQNSNFLINILQLVWFIFQAIVYLVWGLDVVLMLLGLILFFVSISPGIITISIDILISVWNLISRIIPMPYIDVNCTKRYFSFWIKAIPSEEKMEPLLKTMMSVGFIGGWILLFIYGTYVL